MPPIPSLRRPLHPLVLSAIASALLLAGCANLAPDYQRPAAPVPTAWAAPTVYSATTNTTATAGTGQATALQAETDWRDVITDAHLRGTIDLALQHSRDLRLAVLAIEKARAAYRIEDAATLPTVNGSAGLSASRTPGQATTTGLATQSRTYSAGLGISAYEVDLFGRVKNLKEVALEAYFNTEEAQRSTRLSLIAEVANAWLTLAADQSQWALAQETLQSQQATYELTAKKQALGAASGLTLAQTQTAVESARSDVASYAAQVQQDLNALNLLVGTAVPPELQPPATLSDQSAVLVGVPADLPSEVLQRRPDVLAAEHALKGANANMGAARAALFPSISLTASAGTASRNLGDLFKGGAWSFAPSVSLPIFDGGAAKAELKSAEVARDIQLATYEQTVQTAFKEVANALAVRASLAEQLKAQTALVNAWQRSHDLSQARYRGGADSYLDVLTAQRSLYSAKQSLITVQLADLSNRVTLFKVLGGGWQSGATTQASAP